MNQDEFIARLDEKFNAQKEHLDFRFNEQDKKITVAFDFINNKLAKKEDFDNHVKNHASGIKIFAVIFSIILGAWNIFKDLLPSTSPK
ncbi:MAG: hypothetical protein AABY22_36300 [Nanoarchaeota archaeon]